MKQYINFLCVLIMALTLADIVLDLFFTEGHTVLMIDLDTVSLAGLLGLLFTSLATLVVIAMAFVYFIRFILNVNRHEVFTTKNISLLRKYGVCILVVGVCTIILSATAVTGTSVTHLLADGINALAEGAFALLMGEVFSIGLSLQEGKGAAR